MSETESNTENKQNYYRYDDRTYINVPEAKDDENLRNQIKEAGAKWDNSRKSWYYVESAASNPDYLNRFDKISADSLTKVVVRFLVIGKDERNDEVNAALKACNSIYDTDNKAWRVQETNNQLPEVLRKFKQIDYKELKRRVYVNVPYAERGNKSKTEGLLWDRTVQSFYMAMPRNQPVPAEIKGYKVYTPTPSSGKTMYFKLPEARTNENFRRAIKDLGAVWTPTYQEWSIKVSQDNPLPELLQKYTPTDYSELVKHTRHQFKIPEATPNAGFNESKRVRDELRAAGAVFNMNDQTYDIWLSEGQDLPPILANRQEFRQEFRKVEKTQEQDQNQGYHHSR